MVYVDVLPYSDVYELHAVLLNFNELGWVFSVYRGYKTLDFHLTSQ